MPETESADTHRDDALFRSLLLRLAALSTEQLSSRTVLSLKSHGMLKSVKASPLSPEVSALLKQKDVRQQVATSPGPLIFVGVADGSRAVLDMAEYLLSEDAEIRVAAIQHFKRLGEFGLLTKPNEHLFAALEEAPSGDIGWEKCSVELYDAVQNDYQVALAGLRQCVEMEFHEGINNLLPRLLRPSAVSIQMVGAKLVHPTQQRADLEKEIDQLSNSDQSVGEVASKYFQRFGHIPLAGKLSMSAALGPKLQGLAGEDEAWSVLWKWANSTKNPICRYHVCQVFCNFPRLIPKDKIVEFWTAIQEVVVPSDDQTDRKWGRDWFIRCELIRHFNNFLAFTMPGVDGEAIAVASMWLSDRLAAAFGTRLAPMQEVVSHELDFSGYVRMLIHLPCGPSTLQTGIQLLQSVWSHSLLCQIQPVIQNRQLNAAASNAVEEIKTALHAAVLSMFPWQPREASSVYAFDLGVTATAVEWITATGDTDKAAFLPGLVALTQQLRDCENIAKELSSTTEANETYQCLAAAAFRSSVYSKDGNFDQLWEIVSEAKWGDVVFGKFASRAMDLTSSALNEARSRGGEKWNAYLPHLFATRIQPVGQDDNRSALLFAFTIISALSSNNYSAIYRLMDSTSRIQPEWIVRWKKNLESLQQIVPPWISGRIGSLLLAFQYANADLVITNC